MTTKTDLILSSEFEAGMIILFHGARFRLRDDVKQHQPRRDDDLPFTTATGDWIDGEVVAGYFGPNKPWRFQGNDRASWRREIV
jgi:hypothetical protein